MRAIFICLALSLTSCAAFPGLVASLFGSHVSEAYPPGDLFNYRAELVLTVDGVVFDGMAVTRSLPHTTIHIQSKFPLDRIQVTSCGRQDVIRDFRNDWFSKTQAYDYEYQPNQMELSGKCALYIEAFSKSALASWGFVAFRTDENLPGAMDCNGEHMPKAGWSICQTKAGLDQSISFKTDIKKYRAEPGCGAKQVDARHFTLRPALGWCAATFYDGKDFHVVTLLGYKRVLVTGE